MERRRVSRIQKYVLRRGLFPLHWHAQVFSPPPRVPRARVVCLTPPPGANQARTCLVSTCLRSLCVPCRPSTLLLRLKLIDSTGSWKVRAYCCQPGRSTLLRSCGPESTITAVVLVHHLYTWEGGENAGWEGWDQRSQWMHANSVGANMSDTCGYKTF